MGGGKDSGKGSPGSESSSSSLPRVIQGEHGTYLEYRPRSYILMGRDGKKRHDNESKGKAAPGSSSAQKGQGKFNGNTSVQKGTANGGGVVQKGAVKGGPTTTTSTSPATTKGGTGKGGHLDTMVHVADVKGKGKDGCREQTSTIKTPKGESKGGFHDKNAKDNLKGKDGYVDPGHIKGQGKYNPADSGVQASNMKGEGGGRVNSSNQVGKASGKAKNGYRDSSIQIADVKGKGNKSVSDEMQTSATKGNGEGGKTNAKDNDSSIQMNDEHSEATDASNAPQKGKGKDGNTDGKGQDGYKGSSKGKKGVSGAAKGMGHDSSIQVNHEKGEAKDGSNAPEKGNGMDGKTKGKGKDGYKDSPIQVANVKGKGKTAGANSKGMCSNEGSSNNFAAFLAITASGQDMEVEATTGHQNETQATMVVEKGPGKGDTIAQKGKQGTSKGDTVAQKGKKGMSKGDTIAQKGAGKEDTITQGKGNEDAIAKGKGKEDAIAKGKGKEDAIAQKGKGNEYVVVQKGKGKENAIAQKGKGKEDAVAQGKGKEDTIAQKGKGKDDAVAQKGKGKEDTMAQKGKGKEDTIAQKGKGKEDIKGKGKCQTSLGTHGKGGGPSPSCILATPDRKRPASTSPDDNKKAVCRRVSFGSAESTTAEGQDA